MNRHYTAEMEYWQHGGPLGTPLPHTDFFQIGRWPETSLVYSWQPAPPEQTQITGLLCVRRILSPLIRERIVTVESWANLHF